MFEFETEVEFLGEPRIGIIFWDPIGDLVVVRAVNVRLVIKHSWTAKGDLKSWEEIIELNIKPILSDDQIWEFAQMVRADLDRKARDDFSDSVMQDWEERNHRLLSGYRKAAR